MYTLRTIKKDGLEVNSRLGDQYFYAGRFTGYEAFKQMFKDLYNRDHFADMDPESHQESKRVIGIIRDDKGNMNAIYQDEDNYIMTEGGQTFCRLNRAE